MTTPSPVKTLLKPIDRRDADEIIAVLFSTVCPVDAVVHLPTMEIWTRKAARNINWQPFSCPSCGSSTEVHYAKCQALFHEIDDEESVRYSMQFTNRFFEPATPPTPESILQEAERIINGPRRDAYGPVEESFGRIAAVWSVVLKHPVTAHQVALCMAGLKLCREANKPGRDNRVDGAAYFELANKVAPE